MKLSFTAQILFNGVLPFNEQLHIFNPLQCGAVVQISAGVHQLQTFVKKFVLRILNPLFPLLFDKIMYDNHDCDVKQ